MIFGIGTDIADIIRFINYNKLAVKILTDFEFEEFSKEDNKQLYIVKKWAAKEAISKAFGTGISDIVTWKNIEISHSKSGKPLVNFLNELKIYTDNINIICHLSISDTDNNVMAYSIIEYRSTNT
jgi:holo-[acyl-carrier protein] synthase